VGIERRLADLEKLYNADHGPDLEEGWEERMRASLSLAEERAAGEEAEGGTSRRRALDELYRWMERREDGF
jgi:hypothetical protein